MNEDQVNKAWHAGYQAGRDDGLHQRCQHHFAYWDTWWGFLIFCAIATTTVDILQRLLGWS